MIRKIPYYKLLLFILLIIGVFAQENEMGDIDALLIDGMTSIAHQLCELPYEEIVIESRSIKKERKKVVKEDISNFHSSFNIGVLTNKNINLLQYTRDYRIGNNNSIFYALGFPNIGI